MDNYDFEIPDNTPEEIKRMLFLWVAVISKAIDDLHSKSEFNSMRAYVWFTDTSNDIGSFSWICTLMDINAENAKRRITSDFKQKKASLQTC